MKKLLLSAIVGALLLVSAPVFAQQIPAGRCPIGQGGATSGFYAADCPFIDVTAPPYRAVFNGVANVGTAIQAAIDAVPSGGTARIFIPCGNRVGIVTASINMRRGVSLESCIGGEDQGDVEAARSGAVLKWAGAAGAPGAGNPIINMKGVNHSGVKGLILDCDSVVECYGIRYWSDNNPTSSYNYIYNVLVLNMQIGLVIGSPTATAPPGLTCEGQFTISNCAQADNLDIYDFNVKGDPTNTTGVGIHVNDGNGGQSSLWRTGNFQHVAMGFRFVWNNGHIVVQGFNGGNPVGVKAFFKFEENLLGPPMLINNETEGSWDYAVDDQMLIAGAGIPGYRYAHVWQYNGWNNPVRCAGNSYIISIGNNGGGAGNAWTAGGNCRVISMFDSTNLPETTTSPWTTAGSGQVSSWGNINAQMLLQTQNLIAGAIPAGLEIGSGNLAASSTATDGRLTLGSDGAVRFTRAGTGGGATVSLTGASLGVGTYPSGAGVGDLYSSRSTTAGAIFLGSDSTAYLYRAAGIFNIAGMMPRISVNQLATMNAIAGTNLQIEGTNATNNRVQLDAFGGGAFFTAARANNTGSSPSVLVANDQIGGFNFHGFAGTAATMNGPSASFRGFAAGTWSVSNWGSYAEIATTPNSSTTMAAVARFEQSGGITVPPAVTGGDKGAGTINVSGGFYINGSAISGTSMTTNTVLGNATGSTAAPTNLAMPSCSASASALIWTTNTGFGCSSTLAALNVAQSFTADQTVTTNFRVGSASNPLLNLSKAGISGGVTLTGASQGTLVYNITGGATDQKNWDFNCGSTTCVFRAVDDAYGAAANAWLITRGAGATIASFGIPNGVFTVSDATDTTSTASGSLRTAGGLAATKAITAGTGYRLASTLMVSSTAPTIASGFCTSPTVPNANGTAAFTVNVGSACAGSTGVITMPTAATGWVCSAYNITTPATNVVNQTAGTTTSVTVTNYVRTTGVAGNFTSSDVLRFQCSAY